MSAGWSLDWTMKDPETDRPWDLSKTEVQAKVRRMVSKDKPFMLIGSPPLHCVLAVARAEQLPP